MAFKDSRTAVHAWDLKTIAFCRNCRIGKGSAYRRPAPRGPRDHRRAGFRLHAEDARSGNAPRRPVGLVSIRDKARRANLISR